jgi:hypothetical protein
MECLQLAHAVNRERGQHARWTLGKFQLAERHAPDNKSRPQNRPRRLSLGTRIPRWSIDRGSRDEGAGGNGLRGRVADGGWAPARYVSTCISQNQACVLTEAARTAPAAHGIMRAV